MPTPANARAFALWRDGFRKQRFDEYTKAARLVQRKYRRHLHVVPIANAGRCGVQLQCTTVHVPRTT